MYVYIYISVYVYNSYARRCEKSDDPAMVPGWRQGLGAAEAEFQALALVTATAAGLATPEVEIQFLHLKRSKNSHH